MQTSFALEPGKLPSLGVQTDSRTLKHVRSRMSSGTIKAGKAVFNVPGFGGPASSFADPGQVYQNPSPAAAADLDAITVNGTSATGTSTLADGVVGTSVMMPARKLTITFDASTDWDATNGTITYYDQNGDLKSETIAIATSTAPVTTGYVSQFVSFTKPAQTGAGGAYTIGFAILDSSVTLADFAGVAMASPCAVPYSSTADFGDEVSIGVMYKGALCVETEGTPAFGDDVYVGTAASNFGKFRNDNTNAVAVTGAKFGLCDNTNNKAAIELF